MKLIKQGGEKLREPYRAHIESDIKTTKDISASKLLWLTNVPYSYIHNNYLPLSKQVQKATWGTQRHKSVQKHLIGLQHLKH